MSGDPRRGGPTGSSEPFLPADPYATLGLPPGAPLGEVKRAYRRLAKAFHPDSAGPEALPRFLAIHEAYERIATGRTLPGATTRGPSEVRREPWRADPARARATRRRATQGGPTGRPSDARAGAGDATAGATSSGSGTRGRSGTTGRRQATRKATLGSTSYDEARERVDATWSGASWYGPTSGEYWIINPREYADPRKHGPAYQARVRQAAAEAAAAEAAADVVFDGPPFEAEMPSPDGPPTHAAPRAHEARAPRQAPPQRGGATARPVAATPERPWFTGETGPAAGVGTSPTDSDPEAGWARWPLLGSPADDPIRRLRLALVGWPPLGVAAAIAAGDVTGCAAYAASCTGIAPLLPWLAQVGILALLMLLPPLARFLAFGTIGVLLALVPATAVLLALGAGSAPQAGFALGVLLALAWLAGLSYAAVSAARRASLRSPR